MGNGEQGREVDLPEKAHVLKNIFERNLTSIGSSPQTRGLSKEDKQTFLLKK